MRLLPIPKHGNNTGKQTNSDCRIFKVIYNYLKWDECTCSKKKTNFQKEHIFPRTSQYLLLTKFISKAHYGFCSVVV